MDFPHRHVGRLDVPAEAIAIEQRAMRPIVQFGKPQYGAFHPRQQPHPDLEGRSRDLERLIEAAKYQALIGRPEVASRSDIVRYAAGGIIDVVAVRKVDDLFAKERLLV